MLSAADYLAFLRKPYGQSERQRDDSNRGFLHWGRLRAEQLGIPVDKVYRESVNANPNRRAVVEQLFEDTLLNPLRSLLPDFVRDSISGVPVGILPIRALNAVTLRAPSGEPLIILNRGLFTVASHYAEVQTSVGVLDDDGVQAEYLLRRERDIVRYVRLSGKVPIPDEVLPQSVELYFLSNLIAFGMELFVLLHELVHVHEDHYLEGAGIVSQDLILDREPVEVEIFDKSWSEEYVADRLAWSLYIDVVARLPLIVDFVEAAKPLPGALFGMLGPFYFFELAALIEKNVERVEVASHPPALDRLQRLLSTLEHDPTGRLEEIGLTELARRSLVSAETMPRFDADYRLLGID